MGEVTPRLLTTNAAIDYLGGQISQNTFREVVAPHLRRVTITPRNFGYLREDLDSYLDRLAGIERKNEATASRPFLDSVLSP